MKRLLIALVALVALIGSADAAKRKPRPVVSAAKPAGPAETRYRKLPCVGSISIDVATSNVLSQMNAQAMALPASVTKLMTALLVLEDVKASRYSIDEMVTATSEVYMSEPSWVGIKAGEKMSVRDLLMALMVESANDAAIMLGVHSAGSLAGFVAKMNARARELGMVNTVYYNPNGLPPKGKRYPWREFNRTTAADQAKLAMALVVDNPQIFEFTSVKTCDLVKGANGFRVAVTRRVNGGAPVATQLGAGEKLVKAMKNHNNVMRTEKLKIVNSDGKEAIDGLKTGYIDAGGSSIILTGTRKGRRAIVVVLGSATSEARDTEARRLMVDALGTISW